MPKMWTGESVPAPKHVEIKIVRNTRRTLYVCSVITSSMHRFNYHRLLSRRRVLVCLRCSRRHLAAMGRDKDRHGVSLCVLHNCTHLFACFPRNRRKTRHVHRGSCSAVGYQSVVPPAVGEGSCGPYCTPTSRVTTSYHRRSCVASYR